jgi:2-polyprenyl-3-methyl-5-hydroxy-6-metoxy-1,4-benzoquinol methylase
MFDWAKISADPNARELSQRWGDFYESISELVDLSGLGVSDKDAFNIQLISSKASDGDVLDIGIAEHTTDYVNDANKWFHLKLRNSPIGKSVWGLDINAELIDYIREKFGWKNLVAHDATAEPIFGERFSVIHAGSVIEHVSDVGRFMTFCNRSLKPGGALIISTPNPHSWEFIKRMKLFATVPMNFEHTAYITPTAINEHCRRAGLVFEKSFYLCGRSRAKRARLFPSFYRRYRDFIWFRHIYLLRKPIASSGSVAV